MPFTHYASCLATIEVRFLKCFTQVKYYANSRRQLILQPRAPVHNHCLKSSCQPPARPYAFSQETKNHKKSTQYSLSASRYRRVYLRYEEGSSRNSRWTCPVTHCTQCFFRRSHEDFALKSAGVGPWILGLQVSFTPFTLSISQVWPYRSPHHLRSPSSAMWHKSRRRSLCAPLCYSQSNTEKSINSIS